MKELLTEISHWLLTICVGIQLLINYQTHNRISNVEKTLGLNTTNNSLSVPSTPTTTK